MKFYHAFSPVFIFDVRCFLRVAVSLLCRIQAVSKRNVPIYPYLTVVKEDEIVRTCDWHSNETVILMKQVTKNKSMRKWMVEFLRKSESRGDEIASGN